MEDGQLKYRKFNRAHTSDELGEWKLCVRSAEEKGRILHACHASALGWPS